MAAVAHCLISEISQRPIEGIILLNKDLNEELTSKFGSRYYIKN